MLFDRRKDMEKFVAVAETGSILGASFALNIGQPALSRTIARLEHRSGRQLFNRHPRGVTLTPFGAKALQCARRLLVEYKAVDSELRA